MNMVIVIADIEDVFYFPFVYPDHLFFITLDLCTCIHSLSYNSVLLFILWLEVSHLGMLFA